MQPTKALVSLRYVTRIAAVIILVMVAVGFFLPSNYKIERSVVVNESNVSELEGRLFEANRWNDWMYIQSGVLQIEDSGQSGIDGARFQIQYDDSSKQGNVLVQSAASNSIQFLVTPSASVNPIPNAITLSKVPEGTMVRWVIEGELDAGFLSPYLALLANSLAGSNLEKSLAQLSTF